jgi:hypothetical protein
VHGVLGQPARLQRGQEPLQLGCRQLVEGPYRALLQVALHFLPVPADGLLAAAQDLQVEQPLPDERFEPRLRAEPRSGGRHGRDLFLVGL